MSSTNLSFHDFQSFQRFLRNRNIDGPTAVVLTEMYVQQLDLAKQLDQCANILTSLVQTVANFTELHDATQGRVAELHKMINGDVKFESVPMTDETDYN